MRPTAVLQVSKPVQDAKGQWFDHLGLPVDWFTARLLAEDVDLSKAYFASPDHLSPEHLSKDISSQEAGGSVTLTFLDAEVPPEEQRRVLAAYRTVAYSMGFEFPRVRVRGPNYAGINQLSIELSRRKGV